MPTDWALKPSGLNVGDTFRLLFITSTKRDATATGIATYNTFVQTAAGSGHGDIQAYASHFRVVGCTAAVNAKDNTGTTGTGVPIYWLNGAKVANNYADFYDNSWSNNADADPTVESGAQVSQSDFNARLPWTGCNGDGTSHSSGYLGVSSDAFARGGGRGSTTNPLNAGHDVASGNFPFYALSPVFKVTETPTITFDELTYTVNEAVGEAELGITLSRALEETVEVSLAYMDLSSQSADYRPVTSVTIPAGRTRATVRVPIVDDEEPEDNELVLITLTPPANVDAGANVATNLIIQDNDRYRTVDGYTIGGHIEPDQVFAPTIHEGHTRTFLVTRIPVNWTSGATAQLLDTGTDLITGAAASTATGQVTAGGSGNCSQSGVDVCIERTHWDAARRIVSVQVTAHRDSNAEGDEQFVIRIRDTGSSNSHDFLVTLTEDPADYEQSGSFEAGNFRCSAPILQPHDVFPGKTNTELTDTEIRQWMAEVNRQKLRAYTPPTGLVVDWDRDSYAVGDRATIRFRTADGRPSCAGLHFTINLGSQPGFWEQNPPITAHWQTEYNARIGVKLNRGESETTMSVPVVAPGTASFRVTGVSSHHARGPVPTPVDGDGTTLEPHVEATARVCTGTCPSMGEVPLPEVSIAGAFSGNEGDQAGFTLQADPAPPAGQTLEVDVTVTAEGDFGVEAGPRKVTVGSDGYAELLLETTGDDVDEPDGSVTLTIEPRAGHYTLGVPATVTTGIVDDDEPVDELSDGNDPNDNTLPAAHPVVKYASLVKSFHDRITAKAQHGDGPAGGWNKRFLKAMGHPDYVNYPQAAVTVADATRLWNHGGPGANTAWNGTVEAVTYAEQYFAGQITPPTPTPDPVPVPQVSIAAGADVTEGGSASFELTATPAPSAPLDVTVTIAASGDYGITAGERTVTIPTTGSATLTLATTGDDVDEPNGSVTATVDAGTGYTVGAASTGTVAIADDDLPPPAVSIAAKAASITEGGDAAFTVTADRAVDANLAVTLAVAEAAGSDFVAAADEGTQTAVIEAGKSTATLTVRTDDDAVDEPDGSVTATVKAGSGYTVASSNNAASVAVNDNDAAPSVPMLSVDDATGPEGTWMMFTVRLSAPSDRTVQVSIRSRESTPVSARSGRDFLIQRYHVTFGPGETEKRRGFYIRDDSHDDGGETFEVYVSWSNGAPVADGVGVGTITNSDPLPAAYLARFGRTVAEQALDGIAGRMAAPRTPGMQGSIAGQALNFDPAASDQSAAGELTMIGATPGASGTTPAIPSANRDAALAMADIARGLGADASASAGPVSAADPFDDDRLGFGTSSLQSRTMTARDVLLGSSFSLTGQRDGAGGSLAFWGRASQGSFDGAERGDGTDIRLDGTVTTGMLGADYARGKWLVGLALTQSTSEGKYAAMSDEGVDPCPGTDAVLCDGAVRAGDGDVEASLTAAIPYAALRVSERLKLWGAAGYGSGEVTLKTMEESYKADTSWTMAAAGVRGDLLAPPDDGSSGPALALTSDALWARTSSEKTGELAATDSDATRLRLGLEGSYRMALEGDGHLTPKLEIGMRHDGGDAETGFGVEVGGGIAWADPTLGLSLDLSGRTLLAHENDDLKDRGYSASLAFDPSPSTQRGPSLSLRQDFGGQAQGGLDALFAPAPLEDRTGSEATSRWAMEAAWGFPAFGGRFVGSPHVGLGLATGARDYSVGWRLTPEAATAPDLSFGLRATRRESDTAEAEHTVGFELTARW